jgi:hypothetical protein
MIPPLSLVGASLPTYSTNPALTPPNNFSKVITPSLSSQRQGFTMKEYQEIESRIADSNVTRQILENAKKEIKFYIDFLTQYPNLGTIRPTPRAEMYNSFAEAQEDSSLMYSMWGAFLNLQMDIINHPRENRPFDQNARTTMWQGLLQNVESKLT